MAHKPHTGRKAKPLTAQQRVKRSQNAKKRLRGVNGRFLDGLRASGALQAAQQGGGGSRRDREAERLRRAAERASKNPQGPDRPRAAPRAPRTSPGTQNVPFGTSPSFAREVGQQLHSDAQRQVHSDPEGAARELAYYKTGRATGRIQVDESKNPVVMEDITHSPMRVRSAAVREASKAQREKSWGEAGAYRTGTRKPPQQFIEEEMSAGHRRTVENLLSTPGSPFTRGFEGQVQTTRGRYAPGVRRRLETYTDRLQEGYSHDEALSYLSQERRGRPRAAPRGAAKPTPRTQRVPAQKSKYESATPRANEMRVGVDAKAVSKIADLAERFPDRSERELVQIQQSERENIYSDFLRNQKWAHETKRANILGDKGGTQERKNEDRVVFFTTSLGGPAPSVPSDSLIGQYIIRKRKRMMKEAGVPNSQLRGEFPNAVRDMHIFEWSTGVSYGIEGRQGAYKNTGFRNRNKASKGYGRPRPLGSQIIYGSDGRPVYDNNGNIRYSEGATRAVDWQSPNVGLRIFIG